MQAIRAYYATVTHMALQDIVLLDLLVAKGPGYGDAAYSSEPTVIEYNVKHGAEIKSKWSDSLVMIYPSDGVFWQSHPL